ncbi:MAG: hypothetical protein ACI9SQ_002031 [Rubritalea sp.]|jgi:hypothetical protein
MKTTLLLLITCTSVLITSCDSTTPLNTGVDELALATVLKTPADGDTIIFSNTDAKPDPFLAEIELTGLVTATPNISYTYRQVSLQVFTLDVSLQNDLAANLNVPINNLLGEPTTLISRFRELLFRDEVDFTEAELQEIVDLMNPSGASLLINPDDPTEIMATTDRRYSFEVRSNQGDKILGSMGGVYFAEENSIVVGFRSPTVTELNTFRFLTIKHKIPFLTGQRNNIQVTERGNFVIDLINRNGQPR